MVVDTLTPVPAELRERLRTGPEDAATHAAALDSIPALHEIELRGPFPRGGAAGCLRIAAWNVEHLRDPRGIAACLRRARIDVALLGEVDIGMARSGNRHGIAALAAELGGGHAFGVEFVELEVPPDGAANAQGFHGNGLASALDLHRPFLVRLDTGGDWFRRDRNERRVGGRMALGAQVMLDGRAVTVVSVHLESHSDPADRCAQMERLLDAIDRYDPAAPVVIGGDLNTSTRSHTERLALRRGLPPDPAAERRRRLEVTPWESLFDRLAAHGYDWRAANCDTPTQRVTRPGKIPGRIDWFLTRGATARAPAVLPAVGEDGRALSDHDCVTVEIVFP